MYESIPASDPFLIELLLFKAFRIDHLKQVSLMINFKQAWLFLIDIECLVRALILHEFDVIHVAQIEDIDIISDQELSLHYHVVKAFSSVIFNL